MPNIILQEMSRKNKENAAKNVLPHYTGSGGYAYGNRTWDKSQPIIPTASSSSSSTSSVAPITHDRAPRAWNYLRARTKTKQKEDGSKELEIVNPATNEIALRLVSFPN